MSKRINVSIRVRPVLKNSSASATHQAEKFELMAVKKMGDGGILVEEQKPGQVCRSQQYTFDSVFDGDTTQLDLYEEGVIDLVDGALIGHSATVIAYGQTGSGKTHTMLGEVKPNPLEDDLLTPNSGVLLRILSDLLEFKARKSKNTHVVIGLSCVEIYQEKIRDLFGGKDLEADPPEIKCQIIGETVLMPGLILTEVSSMMSVFNELQMAIGRRQSRATDSNATSSRSHCIFQIDILQQSHRSPLPPTLDAIQAHFQRVAKTSSSASGHSKAAASPLGGADGGGEKDFAGITFKVPGNKEPVKFSRILVCDLAGSEKTDKSNVTGLGFKEATAINTSLTALGNVVHSLYHGASHIKYRDSNLTSLLMPAFAQDTSRVLLLAHCSPTQLTYDESISTLNFANKVKAAKVSSSMSEVDNFIPEFLESLKVHDAYTADLRIFGADTQAKCLLTKNELSLLSNKFRAINIGSACPSEGARIKDLESSGAMRKAQAQVEEITAKERRELETLRAKLPEMVNSVVSAYRSRCQAAREAIAKCRVGGLPFVQENAENFYLQLCEEAETEFAEFEKAQADSVMSLKRAHDGAVSEALSRVRAVAIPRIQMDEEFVVRTAKEDELYSLSCAAHCNGRRFLNVFLEMRDTHAALLVCLNNIAAARTWLDKQPKAERKEEDES